MIQSKKIVVVMPAYNAEKTLLKTYEELPLEHVDEVILVDDSSSDETAAIAARLGITTVVHPANKGYGANQKTCYREALAVKGDIIVMLHPDYQYSPRLIPAMACMLASGQYDIVLGSRILGGGALKGGMPFYKYIANRGLTFLQNRVLGANLSEYHTGYRAFSRTVLETLPLELNSDNFVFDNEVLVQAVHHGFRIGELSCPTKYFREASSIGFFKSVHYGLGVLNTLRRYLLHKAGLATYSFLGPRKQ